MTAPHSPAPSSISYIRPAMGLIAGLGITALITGPGIIMATLAMLRGVGDPRGFQPTTANLLVYLAIIALGALAGGVATARITTGRSFYTVFLLGSVLFMSAMVVVLRGDTSAQARPRWYSISQAVIVLIAVLLGGYVERRRNPAR
ncbi:MAG: hypothetical protein LH467_14695 [Gemmatimonadaceae bacterium]|nr:hypothetical protein [Gemmatimonadaceae bacterium]